MINTIFLLALPYPVIAFPAKVFSYLIHVTVQSSDVLPVTNYDIKSRLSPYHAENSHCGPITDARSGRIMFLSCFLLVELPSQQQQLLRCQRHAFPTL